MSTTRQKTRTTAVEDDLFNRLITLGKRAPSTHNAQPWFFVVDTKKQAIQVFLDRDFVLPQSDPTGRQALISIGCAIENICTGAAGEGFVAEFSPAAISPSSVTPTKKRGEKIYCGVIHLKKGKAPKDTLSLVPYVEKRRSLRVEYNPNTPVPKNTMSELRKISEKGVTLHLFTDRNTIAKFAEWQSQADGFVMNNSAFAKELSTWLPPKSSANGRGIPGGAFGLSDKQAVRIHKGLSGKGTLEPEDMLKFALGAKIGIEKSPLICVIEVAKETPTSLLLTGRVLERALLVFTKHSVATAILAGIIEVPLIHDVAKHSLKIKGRIVALFRAGYPRDPKEKRAESPRV